MTDNPEYLQCEPRKFKVTYDEFNDDVVELEFDIVIKCTDQMLHEHNQFWSNHEDRLKYNNNDIVAVMLKFIAKLVLYACYQGKDYISNYHQNGINSIFYEEGFSPDCFEITRIYFSNNVSEDDFKFSKIESKSD